MGNPHRTPGTAGPAWATRRAYAGQPPYVCDLRSLRQVVRKDSPRTGAILMPCHAGEDALVAGLTGQPAMWPTLAACLPPMAATRFGPPIWC